MERLFKKVYAILTIVGVLSVTGVSMAQDSTKCSVDYVASVDLYSRYLWRGAQVGNSFSIQPTAKMVVKNLTVGAWGAYQFDGLYPECDLYATYVLPAGFGVTVTDYFVSAADNALGDYFEYNPDKGSLHQIEGVLSYAGPSSVPVSALVGYTFYGAEWSDDIDTVTNTQPAIANMNGSLYAELGVTIKNLTLFAGAGNKYYTGKTDFKVMNVGAKIVRNIDITDKFVLPVTAQLMMNPNTKKTMFTVGLTF